MTGFKDGILGFEKNSVIKKNMYGQMSRFEPPEEGKGLLSAVVIDIDEITGLARDIFNIYYQED